MVFDTSICIEGKNSAIRKQLESWCNMFNCPVHVENKSCVRCLDCFRDENIGSMNKELDEHLSKIREQFSSSMKEVIGCRVNNHDFNVMSEGFMLGVRFGLEYGLRVGRGGDV